MIGVAILSVLTFNIPAGSAARTILVWSQQSHLQVLYDYRVVLPLRTARLTGSHEPLEGLRQMLKTTRLVAHAVNPNTVAVFEDQHYCHPEWGVGAPLPPCVPQPLTVRLSTPP